MNLKIKNTAKSRIREQKLEEDVFFVEVRNDSDYTDTIQKEVPKRFIQFHFCLEGNATFQFNGGTYQQIIEAGGSMILFNPETPIPLHISISKSAVFCSLIVSLQKLHALFSGVADLNFAGLGKGEKYYQKWDLDGSTRNGIHEMLNAPIQENLRIVYMRAKVLEVLVLLFNQKQGTEHCPYIENEEDLQKLHLAKEIMISDLKHPPTLDEVAQKVGLSSYKLKEGFKRVYGTTLHGFALDAKMEIAKEKIKSKNLKIKEIAVDLGYEHASHFIAAFKRKYGVTPKQYALALAD